MRRTTHYFLSALAVLGLVGASCGSDDDDSGQAATTVASTAAPTTDAPTTTKAPATPAAPTTAAPTGSTAAPVEGDLTVFAAASLTDSFTEIGEAFMTANPDAKVTFSFDSSSNLVTQINEGAPADVYASADQANMTKLTD